MSARPYEKGITGWVIRHEFEPKPGKTLVSWWYGPDDFYSNAWGGLDYSVTVWPTKKAAEKAFRDIFGAREGHTAQRVADAETEQAARIAALNGR